MDFKRFTGNIVKKSQIVLLFSEVLTFRGKCQVYKKAKKKSEKKRGQ